MCNNSSNVTRILNRCWAVKMENYISSDTLISKLPQELWVTIFSHLPFRYKVLSFWYFEVHSWFIMKMITKTCLKGLASCRSLLPMFPPVGSGPPTLQSFVHKALSTTGPFQSVQGCCSSVATVILKIFIHLRMRSEDGGRCMAFKIYHRNID